MARGRQEQDENITKAFEGLAASGGRSFDLTCCDSHLKAGEMRGILEKLPRDLDSLTLRGNVNDREIAKILPDNLRELHILDNSSIYVLSIGLPSTLKALTIEIHGSKYGLSPSMMKDWIKRLPEGLEQINLLGLEKSTAKAFADELGPNLTSLAVVFDKDEGDKIGIVIDHLMGRSGWLSDMLDPPVGHKNILYFYTYPCEYIDHLQALCHKNAQCAETLIVKSLSNCLSEEDVKEAAERLPSMVALAENKAWAKHNSSIGLGLKEADILTMLANLAQAAQNYDISLPIPVKYQDRIAPVLSQTRTVPALAPKSWCRTAPMKYPIQVLDALGVKGSLATVATAALLVQIAFSSGPDVSSVSGNGTPLKLPQVATKPFDIKVGPNGDINVDLHPTEEQKVNLNVHAPIKR